MSNEMENSTQKNRKRKKGDDYRRQQNKLRMRALRASRAGISSESLNIRIKQENNRYDTRKFTAQQPGEKMIYLPPNEKNKVAMQRRRKQDGDYRMREKQKNRAAMRQKRNSEEYRIRENQRNRLAMQMRRQREREMDGQVDVDFQVEIHITE